MAGGCNQLELRGWAGTSADQGLLGAALPAGVWVGAWWAGFRQKAECFSVPGLGFVAQQKSLALPPVLSRWYLKGPTLGQELGDLEGCMAFVWFSH